ncbi:MAG: M23 family metallopeptidase [Actinomycetota bacterium]|nr:M23 family metallopeptidase [Actinomycetota bacterium]
MARLTRARQAVLAAITIGLAVLMLLGAPYATAVPGDPPSPSEPTEPPPSEPPPSEPPPSEPPPSEPPPSEPPPSEPPPSEPAPSEPAPPSGPPAVPPAFDERIDAASEGQEALATEAKRLSRLVFETEDRLEQLEVDAKAAADLYRQAEVDLAAANARAAQTRLAAARAELRLRMAQDDLESFARDTYVNSNTQLVGAMLLLDADSPRDLIERAGMLEQVADSRTEVLDRMLAARDISAAAEQAAADALSAVSAAEAQARGTLQQTSAVLQEQETLLSTLLEEKAKYEAEFYAALVALLGPAGAAAAFAQYEQDVAAQYGAEAAARAAAYAGGPVLSGNWALPLAGRMTSCFCQRWGTMHWGIDIAAPMYTPMYSAGDGVVVDAGPATGFGQAVYIQHDNGDVTVYGHMEVIEVVTGQRVAAGQEIALVGSQGFSTGPHLHFEVYVGGLDGFRVDPVGWLADRGIYV